ncbi:acyl-CoA dehydrogenase family protein [Chloroflexota bacterium]
MCENYHDRKERNQLEATMDFRFTDEDEEFRGEVRNFLEAELAKGSFEVHSDAWLCGFSPEFSRKIGGKGWIGLCWPKEYYGKGKSHIHRLVLTEELLRYGAPAAAHWFGDRQMGPSIIRHGSAEQKEYFLPRIARGEAYFGIGMSEPDAGSDLASVKTYAVEGGDDYVIEGQKVWTSKAHYVEYLYLVVRTDHDAPKHKGISEFIVDMRLPGIEVRPLRDMTGAHHYCEVFFDNVRLPKTSLIGKKNQGWYQITSQLDYERSGIERLMTNYPVYQDLIEYVKKAKPHHPPTEEKVVRDRLADLEVRYEVGRLLTYRVAWVLDQGRSPTYEAAMAKTFCTAFEQYLARVATQILGAYGQLRQGSKWVPPEFRESATESYLFSPGYSLQGGTSEILKSIVALRGLQLPTV